jgi:hypothetical protein
MADDNDRWLHRIPGSRELAWVVRALGPDSYDDIVQLDARRTRRACRRRATASARRSPAARRRRAQPGRATGDVTLVVAVCDGHPSEVADAWGKIARQTVFALYDGKSLAVSLRRSPDCTVDLAGVAAALGGGGHPAAAGCELPDLRTALAALIADRVQRQLA